ncbi:hypothetical protein RRG08_014883 [Elysia crispata]|uniref:Uncharacterized protein n=1 Tax=Elysia crispata TaxID=231223 RepID=A0AAE1AME5_9GAST|nr:hypothetical protein RRG08_014883 [Elysia crispata]
MAPRSELRLFMVGWDSEVTRALKYLGFKYSPNMSFKSLGRSLSKPPRLSGHIEPYFMFLSSSDQNILETFMNMHQLSDSPRG